MVKTHIIFEEETETKERLIKFYPKRGELSKALRLMVKEHLENKEKPQ